MYLLFNMLSPVCLYYLQRINATLNVNANDYNALTFWFLLKLRFPSNKLVTEIIRKIYNAEAVKRLRKFEKFDFKIRKNEADLKFLQTCHQEGLTPKFLNFKLANSDLKHSRTCQSMSVDVIDRRD